VSIERWPRQSQLDYQLTHAKQVVLVDWYRSDARSVWIKLEPDGLVDQQGPNRIRREYHLVKCAAQFRTYSKFRYRGEYDASKAAVLLRPDWKCRRSQKGGDVPECFASDTSALQRRQQLRDD